MWHNEKRKKKDDLLSVAAGAILRRGFSAACSFWDGCSIESICVIPGRLAYFFMRSK